MNTAKLHEKIIAAARRIPVDDRVPFAFEQRIMARLRRRPAADRWAVWVRCFWQAAVPCIGLTAVLCALAFTTRHAGPNSGLLPLSEQFETAVYAAMDYPEDTW